MDGGGDGATAGVSWPDCELRWGCGSSAVWNCVAVASSCGSAAVAHPPGAAVASAVPAIADWPD